MSSYAVHTDDSARWYALLTEAKAETKSCVGQELEAYLVFMLLRYVGRPELAHRCLANEYLECLLRTGEMRHDNLRDVGDQCLLFAGLFPEFAERQQVAVSNFVRLGASAYRRLAEDGDPLFLALSNEFVGVMDLLQTMREIGDGYPCLDPITAHQLWQDTGSMHAWRILTEALPAMQIGISNCYIH
jgi:hypothetical protein